MMRIQLPSHELIALAGSIALFATVSTYAVHAAMPANAIELPGEASFDARVIMPEGWKFFTKDAREPRLLAFTRDGERWTSSDVGANADGPWLGLDRRRRLQGVEIGLLLEALKTASWNKCAIGPVDCLEAAPVVAEVVNVAGITTLCGDVALVRQEPVPWAWAAHAHETIMPSTFLRVSVQC